MGWRKGQPINRRLWAEARKVALERAAYRCESCGRPGGPHEVDHRVPLSRGGLPYDLGNLQVLCRRPCHEAKTAGERRGHPPTKEELRWKQFLKDNYS